MGCRTRGAPNWAHPSDCSWTHEEVNGWTCWKSPFLCSSESEMCRVCYGLICCSDVASQCLARCKEAWKFLWLGLSPRGDPRSKPNVCLLPIVESACTFGIVVLLYPEMCIDNLGCCITRFMLNQRIQSACFLSWKSLNASFDYCTSLSISHRCPRRIKFSLLLTCVF